MYDRFAAIERIICVDRVRNATRTNMPWHILASSAVACGMISLRASAHPRGAKKHPLSDLIVMAQCHPSHLTGDIFVFFISLDAYAKMSAHPASD